MCGHDSNETTDDDPRPRSILGRLTDRRPRLASGIGLGFWVGAITVLILHANHIGPQGLATFMFVDSWLIGAGCIGVPVLILNLLGPRLSVRALEMIGGACFTGAVIVTAFVCAGQTRMETWTAVFILIMLLAMGIHALNGAYGLDKREMIARQVRAEEQAKAALALAEAKRERDAAVEDAHLLGIARSFQVQHARATELNNVLSSDTEDLSAACALLQEELHGRHSRHVVNGHNGHPGHNGSTGKVLRLVTGKQDPHAPASHDPD